MAQVPTATGIHEPAFLTRAVLLKVKSWCSVLSRAVRVERGLAGARSTQNTHAPFARLRRAVPSGGRRSLTGGGVTGAGGDPPRR